jgi:D-xylose transport system ATP-binding protein
LMGAGRTELFTSIYGAYSKKADGKVLIDGREVHIGTPDDAIKHGLIFLSEDRKKYGLNLIMSVKKNVTLASLRKISNYGFIRDEYEAQATEEYIKKLQVKTPNQDVEVRNLSGGNQQKVVIAKSLMVSPKVMVLDEPTRGIDVGAKYEIYKIMNQLVNEGVAVIMISSEMEEILGMSDRIVVMSEGKITGELGIDEATQEKLMLASTGRME